MMSEYLFIRYITIPRTNEISEIEFNKMKFEVATESIKRKITDQELADKMQYKLLDPKKKKNTMSALALLNSNIEKPKDIIENVLMDSGLTIFGGQPGSYKSYLAYDCLLACVTGGEFLGKKAEKCNCLIIDKEMRFPTIKRRMSMLSQGREMVDDELERLHIISDDGLTITHKMGFETMKDAESIQYIKTVIKQFDIRVILFDSLVRFTGGNENDTQDMKLVFEACTEFMNELNVSVIILHHLRKESNTNKNITMDALRGSSDLSGAPDYIFLTSKGRKSNRFTQVKNRHDETIKDVCFELYTNNDETIQTINTLDETDENYHDGDTRLKDCENIIIDYIKIRDRSYTDILNHCINENTTSATAKRAITHLMDESNILKGEGHRSKYTLGSAFMTTKERILSSSSHDTISETKGNTLIVSNPIYESIGLRPLKPETNIGTKKKKISDKNNEEGKRLLHDSDGVIDPLEDLEEDI